MHGRHFIFLVFTIILWGTFQLPPTEGSLVKISHASPDLGAVQVLANSSVILKTLHYKEISDYLHIDDGTYIIKLQAEGATVLTEKITFHGDKSYTLAAVGLYKSSKAPLELVTIEDDNTAPERAHYAKIRVVHASPGLPSVDIKYEDERWFSDVSFKETTKYKTVRAGTYPIELFASGDQSTLLSFTLSFKEGEVVTIFIEGLLKDKSVELVSTEDASYSYFRMRISHAVEDVKGVDVFLDDGKHLKTIFSNVKFTRFTNYSLFILSDYVLKIAPTGTKDFILTQPLSPKNIKPDTDYTVVIAGTAESTTLRAVILEDENLPPRNAGEALVRFFHASPGIPAVDIHINGQMVFHDVALLSATRYTKLRGIECQFEIFSSGSKVPILSFTQKLAGGEIYSIFIEGLLQRKTLKQIVIQDASYQFFNLRFSHASPDTEAVDVLIDDGIRLRTLFSRISFGQFTNSTLMVVKNYNIKIISSGSPKKILESFDISKTSTKANAYFTLNLLGLAKTHSLECFLLADEYQPPERSNAAKVRFFHASPGAPSLDLLAYGEVWFRDIPFKGFTEYKNVRAGTYNILIAVTGQKVPVLNLTLKLKEGRVYSIYAEDLLKSLKAVIHEDAAFDFVTLRVAHASPDSPSVDILLDDGIHQKRIFKSLKFGDIGSYDFMVLREYTFLVTPANKRFPVLLSGTTESLCISPDNTYTLSIVGLSAANTLGFSILQDKNDAPGSSGIGLIRFYHVSPGSPPLDIRLNGKLWFYHVAFKNASIYRRIASGTYEGRASLPGEKTPILHFTVVVKGGSINTVFLEGLLKDLKAIVSVDASYRFFSLRASHASPNAPAVDVSLDDGVNVRKLASGLSFGEFSGYSTLVKEDYKVFVTPKGKEGPVVLSFDLKRKDIQNDAPYTLAIVGVSETKKQLDGVLLQDNNAPPADSQSARIRMFHASPDAGAVDVRVEDNYWARDLHFKEISNYVDVNVGSYVVEILSKGDLVTNISVSLEGGKVYSLFLEGFLDGLHVVDQVDATFNYFQLKVAHVAPTAPPIDLYLNGNRLISNLGPESFAPYTTLVQQEYTLKLTKGGSNDAFYQRTFPAHAFLANRLYVLIVMGLWESEKSPLKVVFTQEQIHPPRFQNQTVFRFVNAAPSFPSLDARFNDLPIFLNSEYSSVSPFRNLFGKNYHIGIYGAGKLKDPVHWTTYHLLAGKVYTIYAEEESDSEVKLLVNEETSFSFIRFRITHAAADVGRVDIYVDEKKTFRDLAFSHSTHFLEFLSGTKNLKVRPRNEHTVLLDKNIDFHPNTEQSLVLTGCSHKNCKKPLDAMTFDNDWEFPASSKSYLRIFQGLSFAERVDIKLNQHLVFANVAYGYATSYELVNSGAYLVQVFQAGTNNELLEMTVLLDDQIYTLFLAGHSEKKSSGFMVSDYSRAPFSYLRFLHASPDTSHLDVQLNGEGQFWDVPFAESSGYKRLPVGRYDVRVSLAEQVSSLAQFDKISLSPNTRNSLLLHGQRKGSSGLAVIRLEDNVDLPAGNMIKVRFVHAVPDLGRIDLVANGRIIFANVSYANATPYLALQPADYSLTFSKPTGLSLEGGTLRARGAAVYTIVAEGLAKADPPTVRAVTFIDFAGPEPPKISRRMSTWKIVLIILGVLAGVVLIALGGYMLYRRRRTGQYQTIS